MFAGASEAKGSKAGVDETAGTERSELGTAGVSVSPKAEAATLSGNGID
jgi:hypothetical protein